MRDWLPEGHLVWFILDAVDQLDLSAFLRRYRQDGWGRAAYPPKVMVALLLYAYCVGIRSSRGIERACQENVAFRVITGGKVPDHATIARFRQGFQEELSRLFTEVLWLCGRAGLVRVGTVVVDGTKMAGNASLSANRTYKYLKEEVDRMLKEAEAADAAEGTQVGDEVPEELYDRKRRLEKLKRAVEELERLAEEEAAEEVREHEGRCRKESASGKGKSERKPKSPDPRPRPEAKVNLTDPESRIMKTRHGYIQGYNAQLVVTKDQIIVAADVVQDQNDVRQLHPMLEEVEEELESAGIGKKPRVAVADAGYFSEENLRKEMGLELLVAPRSERRLAQRIDQAPPPRGRNPKGLSPKELMERKFLTKRVQRLYTLRKLVEPVVGQLKAKGDRFLRRGREAARSEFRLMCACHNLLKLWRAVMAGVVRWKKVALQAA
jgi:transposase